MRELTAKQKKFLKELHKEGIVDCDNMSSEQWDKLESMNDTEVLYQNANNFLDELENAE